MTLTRLDPSGGLYYSNAAFPSGSTVTVMDFSAALPDSIQPLDEMYVAVSQLIVSSGSLVVNTPSGWSIIAATPIDIGGTGAVSIMRIFYRRATGSGDDTPVFTATQSGSTTDRQLYVSGTMWMYRGERLKYIRSGSVGSASAGGPTDAATLTGIQKESIIISGAYQTGNDTEPSLSAANSFDNFWTYNPPGVRLPPSHALAEYLPPDEGSWDLPRWNVQRGSSTTEHHDFYMVLKIIKGFVRGRWMGSHPGMVRSS